MDNTINIYVIKSEHLKLRFKLLDATLNTIKTIMNDSKYTVNIIPIMSPTINDIENNINNYNNDINLNPGDITDDDFKKQQTKFNFAQLSNLYKHKRVYGLIKDSNIKHNFIVEDDILLLPEYINNFSNFIKKLSTIEYDLILTCLSNNNDNDKSVDILLSSVFFKILITKNSYFITPETANKLHEYMKVIRFPMRLSLSKFIFDNKNTLRSYILNKHTILEGSKLGIYTTSVNSANFLIQNNSYIQFIEMLNTLNKGQDIDIKIIVNYYKENGLNNPDFQHIMGIIYYKKNMYKEAIETLKDAVKNLKNKEGYMMQNNEILNNCINMHQYYQDDIKKCFELKGIYYTN